MSLGLRARPPQRVRALLLFDTGPGFRNPQARRAWNERARRRAEELAARGRAALGGGGKEARSSRHRSAQGLAHAARGMLAQFDDGAIIDRLPSIAAPTLVLVGAEDANFLAAAQYMAAKIPGARHVTIPAAGHAANLDQPAAFNRAVADFLAGLAS
jgi:pimeloyl-ACP methyl ester carboxylesterase